MRELHFSADLDGNFLERFEAVQEHIHETKLVSEAHNQMETAGVERNTVGFFWKLLVDIECTVVVVPNSYCLVS